MSPYIPKERRAQGGYRPDPSTAGRTPLQPPDQSRYGTVDRIRHGVTEEGGGFVAGCVVCGRESWHLSYGGAEMVVREHAKKHEEKP